MSLFKNGMLFSQLSNFDSIKGIPGLHYRAMPKFPTNRLHKAHLEGLIY